MSQPIEEGMVLGGRYLVTGHVLTSADQDMVLDGRDQVLNRDISILVASPHHATQVAASARELATGERPGTIQVLDLGLSEGRTYLIAGGSPGPDDLLDLTREQQVYVEPFQTDTLGSEIFGESRAYEPHVYEDDEEYYEELGDSFPADEQHERRRPRLLKGLSERLSRGLGSHPATGDTGDKSTGAAGTTAAGAAVAGAGGVAASGASGNDEPPTGGSSWRQDEAPLPDTVDDNDWTGAHDEVTLDPEQTRGALHTEASGRTLDSGDADDAGRTDDADDAGRTDDADDAGHVEDPVGTEALRAGERPEFTGARLPRSGVAEGPDVDADGIDTDEAAASGAGSAKAPTSAAVPVESPDTAGDSTAQLGAESGAAAGAVTEPGSPDRSGAAAAAAAAAGLGAANTDAAGSGRPKVTLWSDDDEAASDTAHPGADRGAEQDPHPIARDPRDDDGDDFQEDYEDEDKPSGARWILGGILALLLILGAVFAFNFLGSNRTPVADEEPPGAPAATEGDESPAAQSDLPEPEIADASRVVPDAPGLSAETDSTLPNAFDGNPATAWQTYSFAQPSFGGYASSMALVIELEEPSAINQVDITQNNGSGGSFTVLLNDDPEFSGARQIAEGSFTGPQVSVPVSGEDGGPAEAQYVIINFTELPRLSNASSSLPYGLRIAEVEIE